ncbi:MAG: hypothetical protein WCT18_03550 [Patescibacteria group bacterium]
MENKKSGVHFVWVLSCGFVPLFLTPIILGCFGFSVTRISMIGIFIGWILTVLALFFLAGSKTERVNRKFFFISLFSVVVMVFFQVFLVDSNNGYAVVLVDRETGERFYKLEENSVLPEGMKEYDSSFVNPLVYERVIGCRKNYSFNSDKIEGANLWLLLQYEVLPEKYKECLATDGWGKSLEVDDLLRGAFSETMTICSQKEMKVLIQDLSELVKKNLRDCLLENFPITENYELKEVIVTNSNSNVSAK